VFILFLALALRTAEASHTFVGGKQQVPVDDEGVKEAAEIIMRKINEEYRGERALMLVAVEEAQCQIVSGIKYSLNLTVGESHCLKNDHRRKCK
ncbi:cystatin, partial [Bracoviriform kariyai]